jgi:hypothetical protein
VLEIRSSKHPLLKNASTSPAPMASYPLWHNRTTPLVLFPLHSHFHLQHRSLTIGISVPWAGTLHWATHRNTTTPRYHPTYRIPPSHLEQQSSRYSSGTSFCFWRRWLCFAVSPLILRYRAAISQSWQLPTWVTSTAATLVWVVGNSGTLRITTTWPGGILVDRHFCSLTEF